MRCFIHCIYAAFKLTYTAFDAATARASRRIRARHKLVLTGTPVQNHVNELWATFDFLMPNFLGSSTLFAKEFAKPIASSLLPVASAASVNTGIEKLKVLHQQVLPFILRREKEQVLQELPPKTITIVRVPMSDLQSKIYAEFCTRSEVRKSLAALNAAVQGAQSDDDGQKGEQSLALGTDALKALLFLRLLCTHPFLVSPNPEMSRTANADYFTIGVCTIYTMSKSQLYSGHFLECLHNALNTYSQRYTLYYLLTTGIGEDSSPRRATPRRWNSPR